MRKVLAVICKFIALILVSIQAPAQSGFKLASLPNFKTHEGKAIPNCRIAYTALGSLNANGSNAILFPTYFGGKSSDLTGFATALIDTTQYFVVLADALGNGISSSPSNTKNFPDITIQDMVEAEYQLLTKILHIQHLYAVMGISMGGMQTFEWLASHPDFMDKALPIVGTPKQSAQDALLWRTEWNIIEEAGADTTARRKAMYQVSALHSLNLYTPSYWTRTEKPENIQAVIQKNGESLARSNNPEDWICQIKAMLKQDIYASSGKSPKDFLSMVKAKVLVVVATQDHMVNPQSSLDFIRNCYSDSLLLTSDCGHMATVCEMGGLGPAAKVFLFSKNATTANGN